VLPRQAQLTNKPEIMGTDISSTGFVPIVYIILTLNTCITYFEMCIIFT
jgi:hypothetical protein